MEDNIEDDDIPVMATGLDRQVPKPKVNDNYVNSLVMLPRGNIYTRGTVIGRKIDASVNAVGRRNDNPIIDTREYRIEFDYVEVSELTANIIAGSMYASCDYS